MKIIKAKNGGFCFGVKSAVDAVKKNAGEHTYTLGDVIHNERVVSELKALGVKSVNSVDEIDDENATVVIRSHGAPPEVYEEIEKRGYGLIDATCPFVKKIHKLVREHYEKGYRIVIIGDPNHPEVKGIAGWCGGEAVVADENFDFDALDGDRKTCFVEQTTFSTEKYSQILKKIRKDRFKTVEIFDTICYTTVSRQNEARKMSEICDKIIVVGSPSSSNTRKLIELAGGGKAEAYGVSGAAELNSLNFCADDTVGVIGGASAPEELIMEVIKYMSEKFTNAVNEEFLKGVEDSFVSYKEGRRVTGKVISADEDGIKVEIGGKNDGFVPAADVNMDGSYNRDDFKAGDEIEVRIGKKDANTGCILLSKKAVDEIREADKVIDTIRNGEYFEIKIDKNVEKGLTARLGTYNIFIPASQVEERFVRDLAKYVGKKLVVTALEIDDAKHKIVASHRKVAEAERKAKEDIFWANVVPNMIVSGVVKRTTAFGAFVSVDGFDCLAHIVDLSWTHIKNVEEVLTVGQSYEFVVLSADREKNRVSLGYKQLQPHPFVACMEKHPVGSVVKGKVVSIVPFGVFVEIEPHIEGLVHVSEVAHTFVKDINEVVKVGDEVDVKILNYDEANRKINLSIKACLPEEEKPARAEGEENGEKKSRKPRAKQDRHDDEGEKEWSGEVSNNPFADLLKDLEVK